LMFFDHGGVTGASEAHADHGSSGPGVATERGGLEHGC
jgi:hypothetical protein